MNFQLENKNVYASDAGQGIDQNKETIVFLHGSGLSHIVWSLTEQFFSNNNFNVLSIDLPGHGNSDGHQNYHAQVNQSVSYTHLTLPTKA